MTTHAGPDAESVPGAPLARPTPYPVVLHLVGAPCLVVGAGPVAARKAHGLLDAGASVTVVAPAIGPDMQSLVDAGPCRFGALGIQVRPYAPPEASDYRLVVAATGDRGVDGRVAADAVAGGSLVNLAGSPDGAGLRDGPVAGTVLLPAVHRAGPVTVAVSTDGTGPALARWLRDRVAAGMDDGAVATLAELVGAARTELLAGGGGPVDWPSVLDRVAPLVAAGRVDEARELLASHLAGHLGTHLDSHLGTTGRRPPQPGTASSLGLPP